MKTGPATLNMNGGHFTEQAVELALRIFDKEGSVFVYNCPNFSDEGRDFADRSQLEELLRDLRIRDAVVSLHVAPGDVLLVDRDRIPLEAFEDDSLPPCVAIFVDCRNGRSLKDALLALPKNEAVSILESLKSERGA
jgi:hypothetical protein